jgi:hypothetical protein
VWVIGNINVPVAPEMGLGATTAGNAPYSQGTGIIVTGEGRTPGKWKAWNYWYIGENWNVAREGGAESSYRLKRRDNISQEFRTPLMIGFPGFRNWRFTGVSGGKFLVKAYFTTKDYTTGEMDSLSSRFVAYVTLKRLVTDGDGQTYEVQQSSSAEGRIVPDASVWTGDDGLTGWRLEIPVAIPASNDAADRIVDVRFEYALYSIAGYMYLDPKVEFVAVG